MLNKSGERRQRKASLRVQQTHHHRHRPCKGEIGQHQPCIVDRQSSVVSGKSGASARITSGIKNPIRIDPEQRGAVRAEHAPANPAAAMPPSVSRTRSRAGTKAAFKPPRQAGGNHIDQLEGNRERVRDETRAEQRREQGIAGIQAVARPVFPKIP
jgi:hypothetical protein